jgi:hypothetical protein
VCNRLEHDPRYYLGKLYYDAVAYGPEELEAVAKIIGRAQRYGPSAADADVKLGIARMHFGTDHPFFPPTRNDGTVITDDQTEIWRSVSENVEAIDSVASWSDADKHAVLGLNAVSLFGL